MSGGDLYSSVFTGGGNNNKKYSNNKTGEQKGWGKKTEWNFRHACEKRGRQLYKSLFLLNDELRNRGP